MVAVIQRSAFQPGVYRVGGKKVGLPGDELRRYAEDTNRAIQAGVPVPALLKHARPGADDEETAQFAATDGAGWLKGVEVEPDNSLAWLLDVPERIKAGLEDGSIRFTSPEFRRHYQSNKEGVDFEGRIIRHVAFTPFPRNPTQGQFETLAMSEDQPEIIQCSTDDYEGPISMADDDTKPKDDDQDDKPADAAASDAVPQDSPPAEQPNPDSPAQATDKSKLEALVECFSAMGAELPSDFDLSDTGKAVDLMLTAMKTLVKSKQEAEAKSDQEDDDDPPVQESQDNGMAFSEDELASMPAAQRKRIEALQKQAAEAAQFAEEREVERIKTARDKLEVAVRRSSLPPFVKQKLNDRLSTVQFSEDGEQPSLTFRELVDLWKKAPVHMQFSEPAAAVVEHADGENFFDGGAETPEKANEIADKVWGKKKAG